MVKALMMAAIRLLLSYIGVDIVTGRERFTLGIATIAGGFDIVPIVMGLFGISEVLLNLERSMPGGRYFKPRSNTSSPIKRTGRCLSAP